MQKDRSECDVVSAITLFSKQWVEAMGMAYEDNAVTEAEAVRERKEEEGGEEETEEEAEEEEKKD